MDKKLILKKIEEIKLKNKNSKNYFQTLAEIAEIRGGKIKDGEVYINNSTKMIFIDKNGNEFKISPSKIKSGQWSHTKNMIFKN